MRGRGGARLEGGVQPPPGSGSLSASRHLVGIDLGTIHTALASIDLAREGDPSDSLAVLPVAQLVAPGEVQERALLPSNVYVPGEHELAEGARALPWGEADLVVGEFARVQGARVPGRLVASAKSWLSHPRVDRTAPILPWGAPEGVARLSPVAASARYLAHLRDAWDHGHPDAPLRAQDVVLTVPASFDEAARELTVRAAREAGLERLTLVEEPAAAFYDFVAHHRANLAEALGGARLVLVVDVGGGTTDFTLIHADVADPAAPKLSRIAVGDHLLLGGDNVDVTLARRAEERLGARLDAVQWSLLVQGCRLAKEALLSPGGAARTTVAVAGRGSRLVGGTLATELTRDEALATLLDGFFPKVGREDLPRRTGRAALLELGLPYESEPAVTRHLLAFLRDHAAEVREATGAAGALPRPDAILLNGGVFTPPEVRERLREVVDSWFPGAPPIRVLDAARLDVAVARGAAYHALVRRGLGLRIGGGTARGYYVGIAPAGDAPPQALCVVPRHAEEGREVEVPRTFALRLDRPVRFPLYATTRARFDRPGDAVPVDDTLAPLPPIETVLRSGGAAAGEVPVRLHAALTEIGTLALWCVAEGGDQRWKLEFQLRGSAGEAGPSEVAAMPRRFDEARALVEKFYGKKAGDVDPRRVKDLARELEKILGPRDGWTTPVIRELWAALHAGQPRRRRSPDHERMWLSLTGYCLRPGFGAPLDAWRAAETFKAFDEGLQFQAEPHIWQAWWVMWRRVAGGLDDAAQARIFAGIAPFLPPHDPRRPRPKVAGVKPEALDELVRLAASLERVAPPRKREAGEQVFARIEREGAAPHLLWSIGRLGARVPFAASGHMAVAPEVAEDWIRRLLAVDAPRRELAFPLAQLARASGDRARDVGPDARDAALAALAEAKAPEDLVRAVREPVALGAADEQRVFGESLPAGLRLVD